MIVPREKLIWSAALIVVPMTTMIGLSPSLAPILLVALAFAIGIAGIDAMRAGALLQGIDVLLRPTTHLFQGRDGEIELTIRNARQTAQVVRVGLNLHPLLVASEEALLLQLPSGAPQATAHLPCTGKERGIYAIPSWHMEAVSPLGLWLARSSGSSTAEVRVYPDILSERKNVSMLFLNRPSVGIHVQRQVGKGREFEKLRDYLPGDSIQDVHWKASAKRNRPVTKVFQIERTQEVYLAIDCSRLSGRATVEHHDSPGAETDSAMLVARTTMLDRYVTAALLLGMATQKQGDLFGLITFSDAVHSVVRARNGKSHYLLCRDTLFKLQPRFVTPDFEEVCSTIRVRLRRRALVIFLSALDDPLLAENFTRGVDLIKRQHLVMVNMIEPGNVAPVFSEASRVESVDDIYGALGAHAHWHKLREVARQLEVRGVDFNVLPDEQLARELIQQYLNVKQRQLI